MARLGRDQLHADGAARAASARRPFSSATPGDERSPSPSTHGRFRGARGIVEPAARPLDEGVVDDRGAQRDLRHLAERRRVGGAEAPRRGEPRARHRVRHVLSQDRGEVSGGHLTEALADGTARPRAGLDETMMPVETHAPRRPDRDPSRTTEACGRAFPSDSRPNPLMRVLQTTASGRVKPGEARSRGVARGRRGPAPRSCRGRPRRSARASGRPPGCRSPRRGSARRRRP